MSMHTESVRDDRSTRGCAACGADSWERRYRVAGHDVERCRRCGVGRARIDGLDPLSIYDEGYFQGGHDDGYADYAGSRAVLELEFRTAVRRLTKAAPRRGRLLEVGCAYGYFLEEARRDGWDVHGVEVVDAAASACRDRGLDVRTGVLDDATLARLGPLDAAVMLDVIEHIERPDEVVRALAGALRPGAPLLLTTGDWESAVARVMGKRWRLMTPPQHLWFFGAQSIRTLLERVGLEVVGVEHPWKRVPLGLIAYQLGRMTRTQRLLGRANGIRAGVPVNLFDAMRVVAVKR